MKILILVLSCPDPPYDAFMNAQFETWDNEKYQNVDVLNYDGVGSWNVNEGIGMNYSEQVSEDYFMMHWKLKKALETINLPYYDFIFRTNSSSYINKERLYEFAKTFPKEKCYAGYSLEGKQAVSGAGIWLSPDMCEILKNEIPEGEQIEEDLLIGQILHVKHKIPIIDDRSRVDIPEVLDPDNTPLNAYHYRFKAHLEREKDVENMYQLHKLLTQ